MSRLLIAALVLAGCLPPRGTSNLDLNYYGRRYCVRSESGRAIAIHVSAGPSSPPEEVLQAIMCSEDLSAHMHGEYHRTAYRQLDPDQPDPLRVAFALVFCVGTGRCGAFNGRPDGPSAGVTSDFYRLALALDLEAVRAALEPVQAPPEVKQSFLLRAGACRDHVVESVRGMSPRLRTVFVETIERTIADRAALQAQTEPHQALYAGLRREIDEALVHEGFTADLHERARALRNGYVRDCMQGETRSAALCANGPLARELTELLVRSAVSLGRHAEALAEQELLLTMGDVRDVRVAIHIAVGEAMARETALHEQYAGASARMQDSDPGERQRLLAESFGPVAPIDMSRWDNAVGMEPPERTSLPRPDARAWEGLITRVRTIDRSSTQLVVEGVHGGEPLRYVVPREEAEHLRAGQRVQLAVARDDDHASVIRARQSAGQDDPVVQLRAFYFGE